MHTLALSTAASAAGEEEESLPPMLSARKVHMKPQAHMSMADLDIHGGTHIKKRVGPLKEKAK